MSDTTTPQPDTDAPADLGFSRVPRHIAIIMDGNGRWAERRGFARVFGHRNGAARVREVLDAGSAIGVEVLTLYSFSSENWDRPDAEVSELMLLCATYCDGEREALARKNIRVKWIGRRAGMPDEPRAALERLEAATGGCTGPTLVLAINYGARAEIADAARSLAREASDGTLDPETIDESMLASRLDTGGLPDPDLLIRTGGDFRVSNYLLWQISYAEIIVTDTLWPDFGRAELFEAVREYAGRSRRFGGLDGGAARS